MAEKKKLSKREIFFQADLTFTELPLFQRRLRRLRERHDADTDVDVIDDDPETCRREPEVVLAAEVQQLVRLRDRVEPEVDRGPAPAEPTQQAVLQPAGANGHLRRWNAAELLVGTLQRRTEMVTDPHLLEANNRCVI